MDKRKGMCRLLISLAAAVVCSVQPVTAWAETTTVPEETTTAPASSTTVTETEVTTTTVTEAAVTEPAVTTPRVIQISDPESRMKFEVLPDDTLCLTEYRWESDEFQITIPEQYEGKTVTKIGERAFLYCYADAVELPSTILEIEDRAFEGCAYLQRITIPGNCTRIGEEAFSKCERLVAVLMGSSVQEIGKNAFAGTRFLASQTGDAVIVGDGILLLYRREAVSPEIPSSVKTIAAYAFADHTEIQSIRLPAAVKRIQDGAFSGCTELSEITLEGGTLDELAGDALDRTKWLEKAKEDYVILGDILVKYRGKETVSEVPDQVRVINDNAYAGNAGITTLKMTDSVERIGKEACQGCTSLQVVMCGDHVRKIDDRAFSDCRTLKYLRVGHELETIGTDSFLGCPYLEEVYLPDTLTEIKSHAFGYAKSDQSEAYEKLRNNLIIYSNTETARAYADASGLKHEPLPDVENTEPAPIVTTVKGKGNGWGQPSGRAWIPAVIIGGVLVLAGILSRKKKRR